MTAPPDGLKFIELPLGKSNIGILSSNKTVKHLPLSKKKKKGTLTWLKVIRGHILLLSTAVLKALFRKSYSDVHKPFKGLVHIIMCRKKWLLYIFGTKSYIVVAIIDNNS